MTQWQFYCGNTQSNLNAIFFLLLIVRFFRLFISLLLDNVQLTILTVSGLLSLALQPSTDLVFKNFFHHFFLVHFFTDNVFFPLFSLLMETCSSRENIYIYIYVYMKSEFLCFELYCSKRVKRELNRILVLTSWSYCNVCFCTYTYIYLVYE